MFFSLALSNHEDLWGEVQMNVNLGKSVIFAKGNCQNSDLNGL